MAMMKFVEVSGTEAKPEAMRLSERPRPAPMAGEVLIRVAGAGVNRPDLLQRAGLYPPPAGASEILGLEVSGRIAAIGAGVQGFAVGDRVVALCDGGGYAEWVAVNAGQVLPAPAGLDWAEAAALPETFFTVWSMVFMAGRLKAGETLLVHGASSGIGTTAILLARGIGAEVVGTVSRPQKVAPLLALGARAIVVRGEAQFEELQRALGEGLADVILDVLGGRQVAENQKLLGHKGRHLQIATLEGRRAEIDLSAMMVREQTFFGARLRPRSPVEKAAIASELRARVWPMIEGGLKPLIAARFPLEQAHAAHAHLERQEHIGKVVLDVDSAAF